MGTETSRRAKRAKACLIFDFQYEYRPRKRGLSILLILGVLSKRCQKSYHRDNWLVAAKRFIATLLFDPSMSALPIIVKQNSPSVGLFHPLIGKRELGFRPS